MAREHYTITEENVGEHFLHILGRCWDLEPVMGYIQPHDVGKHIVKIGDILQVESDAQRDKRLSDQALAKGGMETWGEAEAGAVVRQLVRDTGNVETARQLFRNA